MIWKWNGQNVTEEQAFNRNMAFMLGQRIFIPQNTFILGTGN